MKRESKSRVGTATIAVFAVMSMALVGLVGIAPTAQAKGPCHYDGPPILNLKQGWNMVQWYCDPIFSYSGTPHYWTAEDVLEYAQDVNGNLCPPNGLISAISRYDVATQGWKMHIHELPAINNFQISAMESYMVFCQVQENFDFPYIIPIPAGFVAGYSEAFVTGGGYAAVGWYNSCHDGPPPFPPPSHHVVNVTAHDQFDRLSYCDHSPYTGPGSVSFFNSTSQQWQMFVHQAPSTNFVIWKFWADTGEVVMGDFHLGPLWNLPVSGLLIRSNV